MADITKIPKKRGRKSKKELLAMQNAQEQQPTPEPEEKPAPKKRGRKPKGGKIIPDPIPLSEIAPPKHNIILHIKCSLSELNNNGFTQVNAYNPNVENIEPYNILENKASEQIFKDIGTENDIKIEIKETDNTNNLDNDFLTPTNTITSIQPCCLPDNTNSIIPTNVIVNDNSESSDSTELSLKKLSCKLRKLESNLHTNNIEDQKSACFWDTHDFDSPPIYIPKFCRDGTFYVYGNFCSPECAVAHLMSENLDNSTKFERYALLNNLYGKVCNYTKNIKPAPSPYYTLNKYFGNLSIKEYRKLLQNDRLLLVVDKPLTRILPELYEDQEDNIIDNSTSNQYKLKRNTKKRPNILDNFNNA